MSYQCHYQMTDSCDVAHAFDVHWKVSNTQALADRISHAELWERRVPVPELGASASTVDAEAALLLALLHRAGHHPGSKNLLWTYDLHLLGHALIGRALYLPEGCAADEEHRKLPRSRGDAVRHQAAAGRRPAGPRAVLGIRAAFVVGDEV